MGNEQQAFFSYGSAAMTSDRTDWETPRELFERLNNFWRFDLDAAATVRTSRGRERASKNASQPTRRTSWGWG